MAVIKTQFTLRLDLITHVKIRKIAAKEKRSLTNMIDYLIQKEIKRYEKKYGEIEVTDDDIYLK